MPRTYDDRMFIDTFEHQYTWLNGFLRNVSRYSDRPALLDPLTERNWNYSELNKECNRLAHALKKDGTGKDDVVMTAMLNCPEFVFSYIGPRKIGAILNPANFNLAPGEMAKLIDHNRPKVFMYSPDVRDMVTEAIGLAKNPPEVIIMVDNLRGIELPDGHTAYNDYVRDMPDTDPKQDFIPHIYDEVLRLCTSGTTSLPKSCPINDINEVLSAHDVIMQYPLQSGDITMNMTPWFHRGGIHSGGPGPSLYVGAAVTVMRNFQPKQVLKWTEQFDINYLMGAPSTLEMLARTQKKHPHDLSSLKGLVTMGAPLEKEACEEYMNVLTPRIFNGYGTTETFWNSFLRPFDLPEGSGTAGGSCIDDETRIVKVYDDRKAEPDETVPKDNETTGEIIIWSPAKGTYTYINSPEETEEKFYSGWMYTGDLGVWDEKGYVTIKGRKDDMIVCAAENIYPTQVENAIIEHPKVEDCFAVGVHDKLRGQAVAAYVKAKDESLTAEEVSEFCHNHPDLSAYKRPRYIMITESLPYTPTGKKQRAKLRKSADSDLEEGRLRRV
ncbi:MAG: class I adenylate-forming enzyme family protein [Clostridia bacterium]|nr:class I adenylate-forming enzyme family protein [Clostridia bacterium]